MTAAKTLILVFHPALARSKVNAALATAAAALPDTDVVDMQALYPDGVVDADREVTRLLTADRIVLQFPIYWYSTPPLLKAWQDAVLTRMYYIAYEAEGRRLEGTPILVAATAGNQPRPIPRPAAISSRSKRCSHRSRPPPTAADCPGPIRFWSFARAF